LYLKMKMIRILCQQAGVNLTDTKPGGASRFEPLTPQSGRREEDKREDDRASKRSRTDDDARDEIREKKERKERKHHKADDDEDDMDGAFGDMGDDDDEPRKKKKKKKKKKDKHESSFDEGDPDTGMFSPMLHSQSMPSDLGGKGVKPPSSESMGAPLLDTGMDNGSNAVGLSDNRQRVKAGIRLEPLDPKGISSLPIPLSSSLSVPALP
jgi:hypothetical protein